MIHRSADTETQSQHKNIVSWQRFSFANVVSNLWLEVTFYRFHQRYSEGIRSCAKSMEEMSTVRSQEREHQVDDILLTLRTERRILWSFSCMQYQIVNFTESTADRLYQRLSHPSFTNNSIKFSFLEMVSTINITYDVLSCLLQKLDMQDESVINWWIGVKLVASIMHLKRGIHLPNQNFSKETIATILVSKILCTM